MATETYDVNISGPTLDAQEEYYKYKYKDY